MRCIIVIAYVLENGVIKPTNHDIYKKNCVSIGWMTMDAIFDIIDIIYLLSTVDLLVAEPGDEVWKHVPESWDVEASILRIEVDSFIQIDGGINNISENEDRGDIDASALGNGMSHDAIDDGSNTIKEGDGSKSSQDEYSIVAYKVAEIQHREV